jgi:hypothetical protein
LSDKQIAFTIVDAVRRRRLLVPVLLALSGLGWAAAHAVAHRAVMSDSSMGASAVHQYFSYLTTSLALCLALALPLAAGAVIGKRWQGASARSLWLFGLVPVMGFIGHGTEPFVLGSGGSSNVSELAPLVLVGLLIQIPFALVAVGLARRVLWLAESLARALAGSNRDHAPQPPESYPRPRASRPSGFRLDLSHTERGPPLLAA